MSGPNAIENMERNAYGDVIGNENHKGNSFAVENPHTGEEYIFDSEILVGADWSRMYGFSDGMFTPEEIQKYYEAAMAIKTFYIESDEPRDLGDEIEHDWIQEIWDQVNPGIKLLTHSIKTDEICSLKVGAWTGNQYTVIVYLTPDMTPEDGGSLELWTPNLTDEMKAMALNSPYTFNAP
jgi:hypothetical protein